MSGSVFVLTLRDDDRIDVSEQPDYSAHIRELEARIRNLEEVLERWRRAAMLGIEYSVFWQTPRATSPTWPL